MSDRLIKVLHVGLSSNCGGIENVVRSWNSILPENIRFDFINNGVEDIAYHEEFEKKGGTIYQITSRSQNPYKSYTQLYNIIKKNNYDFVHHHMMSLSWPEPLLIAQNIKGTVPIAHSHCVGSKDLSVKYKLLDCYGRMRLNKKNYYKIACGEAAGKDMFLSDDFIVIQNGIDFSQCRFSQKSRYSIRKKYKISDGTFLIGHVGRMSAQKNYPFILNLFMDFLKSCPNSKLLLIGNVCNDANIIKIVNDNGIANKVIFAGTLTDCKAYYSAMDVFLLPSLFEGVSVAMIEAQVSGLPCIVSNFVSKDADISGNVRYIPIDNTKQGILELLNITLKNRELEKLDLDDSFDLKKTANKMFEFYKTHLEK